MKAYRLAILLKQFSFLNCLCLEGLRSWTQDKTTFLMPDEVGSITVKKCDANLLSQTGSEDTYSWSDGGHSHYTTYFAVTGEEVVELDSAGKSGTGSGRYKEWSAPTIGEQLFDRKINPDWVVECRKKDTDDNGNGRVERRWIVYRMAKFGLTDYHKERIDMAAAELKAEIEAACTEPKLAS